MAYRLHTDSVFVYQCVCVPRPLAHDSCTLNSPLVRNIYWHFYISRTIYRCLLSWSAIICISFVFCHFRFDFWVLGTSVCAICQARWVQNVLPLRVGTAWTPLSLPLSASLSLYIKYGVLAEILLIGKHCWSFLCQLLCLYWNCQSARVGWGEGQRLRIWNVPQLGAQHNFMDSAHKLAL